jgi:hypothetical protein
MITDYFPKRKLGIALSIFTMGIFRIRSCIGYWRWFGCLFTGSRNYQYSLFGAIYHGKNYFLIGFPGLVISFLMFTIRSPA